MNVNQATHYYGDTVRIFLITGAVLMLVTLPVFRNLISMPLWLSLIAILAIGVAAGLTNPVRAGSAWLNVFIAGAALLIFEYYAVDAYGRYGFGSFLFIADQLLALDFLIALYYSVKTVRGMLV